MAWGILEDTKLAEVPGTTLLDREPESSMCSQKKRKKKRKGCVSLLTDTDNDFAAQSFEDAVLKTKDGVVLVPQPSDSPNDPYNW